MNLRNLYLKFFRGRQAAREAGDVADESAACGGYPPARSVMTLSCLPSIVKPSLIFLVALPRGLS